MVNTPPAMTVRDVADWLRISPSLVYQLVEQGKLIVYRIGTGRCGIRFRRQDVDAYLDECRSEKSPPTQPRKQRPRLKHIRVN